MADNVLTVESSQRTNVPEVPYKDAIAAENQLRKLNDDDVYLGAPAATHRRKPTPLRWRRTSRVLPKSS